MEAGAGPDGHTVDQQFPPCRQRHHPRIAAVRRSRLRPSQSGNTRRHHRSSDRPTARVASPEAQKVEMILRRPRLFGVATMTAIVHDAYGTVPENVLRLEVMDKPTVADEQVLVRVHAASVDRGTWHIMAGLPYPIRVAGFGLRKPKYLNPGRSLAGTIEAVSSKVTGFQPDEAVFGICDGSFAEYVGIEPTSLRPSHRTFPSRRRLPCRSRGSQPSRRCATTEQWRAIRTC